MRSVIWGLRVGNLFLCFVLAFLLFLFLWRHHRIISGWEFCDLIIIIVMATLLSLLRSSGSQI